MKNKTLKTIFLLFIVNFSFSQEWMTSLDIAQKLALVQNKMVLMVWEESTKYPYPVLVNNDKGRTILIENLFEDENLNKLKKDITALQEKVNSYTQEKDDAISDVAKGKDKAAATADKSKISAVLPPLA